MDRSPASFLLSWLLVPAAALLVASALSLPHQPYTGLVLSENRVAAVIPGSPAERAGFVPGDRVFAPSGSRRGRLENPISGARPGHPLVLERVRGARHATAWLVPEGQPGSERRIVAALLAVASGFVLIGGWVWSERRDALTRTFLLLCLGFAAIIAPPPQGLARPFDVGISAVLAGITVFLPALCVQFFALFPGTRVRGHAAAWVRAGYAVAAALFTAAMLRELGLLPAAMGGLLLAAAALWFTAGLLIALVLFVLAYRRAASRDARRRLRVALFGTILGAAPFAALIAFRNVAPDTAVPGERGAVLMTLLVPASFAWATAVHRIFDFRVALRAATVTLMLGLVGIAGYLACEWLATTWRPELGVDLAGFSLAFVAVGAALAGPLAPWLATLGARVVPAEGDASLAAWVSSGALRSAVADGERPERAMELVLMEACEAVRHVLRLGGCMALVIDDGAVHAIAAPGSESVREPGPGLRLRAVQLERTGLRSVDDAPLEPADREALEAANIAWLLPIGHEPVRAVLLLGRRLTGPWLRRRETQELERFADHLAITLENLALRREAGSRGELDKELRAAGAIQAHLLPRRAPICPTLDCAAAALSSEPVGGDYYDFIEGPGRDFTLVVGDAAGKGVPAALILAQVQARFRDHARRGWSPGQLLGVLNRELVQLDQPEKFVGLLCARVEVRSGRVWIANAGLMPPLVRRGDGRCEEIESGGVLLGVSLAATYPDTVLELGAGDVLVVYTDGLTEAQCGEEMFGSERVRELVADAHDRRAAGILDALLAGVRTFADRPLDDVTVVVLKQLIEPPHARAVARSHIPLKWTATPADASG